MNNVAALKEQFEQLFPGKWLLKEQKQRHLQTGITGIDSGPSRGIARKRISEWVGSASSGKSTLLRTVIANWCASGMHIVYIDAANKLVPADWAFVDQGICGSKPSNTVPVEREHSPHLTLLEPARSNGRFWVVRNLLSGHKQDALWATEQLVRSNIFDVVIFDATESPPLTSRFYARLQRSLDSSKAALLIIKDEIVHNSEAPTNSSWGCHARFNFGWSTEISQTSVLYGLNGLAALMPAISSSIWKDGITNKHEVAFSAYATNRLFTHPQVPDRRIPKARSSFKK
jgi:hypothetical protein